MLTASEIHRVVYETPHRVYFAWLLAPIWTVILNREVSSEEVTDALGRLRARADELNAQVP